MTAFHGRLRSTGILDPEHESQRVLAILRQQGLVDDVQCVWAEDRADVVGVTPEDALLLAGTINRLSLWQARCMVWGIDWRDVREFPPDAELIRSFGFGNCIRLGVLPYQLDGTRLVFATSVRPTATLETELLSLSASFAPTDAAITWTGCSDLDIDHVLLSACRDQVLWDAADRLTDEHPTETAATGPARWNYPALVALIVTLGLLAVGWPRRTLTVVTVTMSVIFLFGTTFKAVAAFMGGRRLRQRDLLELQALIERAKGTEDAQVTSFAPRRIPDHELPMYTILVPAYREEAVIGKLIQNIEALDYPREKLDVIVLLEEDDVETLQAAKAARPPGYVRLFVTPDGLPKTKPRACNAGLRFAKGTYLVIYDAEDRPDPAQLRDVLSVFERSDERTVVVQCRLNYFNAGTNMLTRFFALEYAAWFDFMLPGLDALRLPIPLGGTSNHFITSALRELGGWDAHNVTEDADLGLRASVKGMRVAVSDSTTWEEACSVWRAWIKQRTRWIKGYMVTALVHTRNPWLSMRRLGVRGTFGLVFLIAGTPLTFLSLPFAWLTGAAVLAIKQTTGEDILPSWALKVSIVNFTFGYASGIIASAFAMARRKAWWLAPYALLNPFYWCMHSVSAFRAAWQLFFTPSVWEKTPHGLDPNHSEETRSH